MLDLQQLVRVDRGHVFLRLDKDVEDGLRILPEVRDRLLNALYFCGRIESDTENRLRGGYLRAALAELVSVEDTLYRLQRRNELRGEVRRLNHSSNPLLHIVRELRNLEIHLRSSTLDSEKRELLWGHVDKPEDATPVSWTIWWLDDLDLQAFEELNNFKRYDRAAFAKALAWFDQAQRQWGISELVLRAIKEYARELYESYVGAANHSSEVFESRDRQFLRGMIRRKGQER
jgi:hypothetical protein